MIEEEEDGLLSNDEPHADDDNVRKYAGDSYLSRKKIVQVTDQIDEED